MSRTVAVLTGDLVASNAAGPMAVDTAMSALSEVVARMTAWGIGVDPRFTRFRGDGWQVMVRQPVFGLRAALILLAALRAARSDLSTRISIGHGGLSMPGTDSLADAAGDAFVASGRGLEQMRKAQRLVIDGTGITPLHKGYGDLLSGLSRQWSVEQAEAMVRALDPENPTLSDIAAGLGITPQAVGYRLAGAAGNEIRAALAAWEQDTTAMAGDTA